MLPNVPAIAETVPGYEAIIWYGVGVPRGTPSEVVGRSTVRSMPDDLGKNESAAFRPRLDADHREPGRVLDLREVRNREMGEGHQAIRRQDRLKSGKAVAPS